MLKFAHCGTKNVAIYACSLGKFLYYGKFACVKDLTNIMSVSVVYVLYQTRMSILKMPPNVSSWTASFSRILFIIRCQQQTLCYAIMRHHVQQHQPTKFLHSLGPINFSRQGVSHTMSLHGQQVSPGFWSSSDVSSRRYAIMRHHVHCPAPPPHQLFALTRSY